ncbi:MAG: D-ribitol-5-phosphate cytidylyltransferase [Oscillospiraceae bacterium]|nr:D-ribitol-5-phosphate cytidylyltransferase [Oscillospiraceae bacterium]
MIYGAILAGGVGKRVERYNYPKQFIPVNGTPIIILTLREFIKNKRFDAVYIAVHKDWKDHLETLLQKNFSQDELKNIRIVEGGKERLDSFMHIMDDIIDKTGLHQEDILICHDSVRPFVRQQMINDCIDATLENQLALTVIPTTDTLHVASDEKYITGTLDRKNLYNGQTPSGFNIVLLKKACDSFTDDVKNSITGTTQLMLKLGYKLRIVNGHTSNFKITTDNDLDVAERMLKSAPKTRQVRVLDCTLRDGGIAVDFNFGNERMQKIKTCLETSGVEFIECGYIDEKKGFPQDRTCFDSEISIQENLLHTGKKEGVTYVAMIDYGTFDVNRLSSRNPKGIDGIRLAFHKEHWRDAVEIGKTILSKGYALYIQPMVSLRYSDEEFCELIDVCNHELAGASGFYIVDSFGQMDSVSLTHMLELADQNVSQNMIIGFHAHNNRQLAYSNALAFLEYNAKHDIMLDASIMGMGKGAGNLCSELITSSLNETGKQYQTSCLYDSISEYFSNIIKEHPWGYSIDYYLSSLYSCTPSYIKIFLKDERVTTDILIDLLKNLPAEKRAACDRAFAAEYLKAYFA